MMSHLKKQCVCCVFPLMIALPALMLSCGPRHEGSEEQLLATADSFATAYYNWHFWDCARHCTDSSQIWLQYAASNVRQADIDLLNAQGEGAGHKITNVSYGQDGSSATVSVSVSHFLQMDTIGTAAHLVEEATFELPMRRTDRGWQVNLGSLPKVKKE